MQTSMRLILVIFLSILNHFGWAQESYDRNLPRIEFENSIYNFGDIAYDSPGDCEFIFKNVGKGPLIIKNVSASCGCTIPHKPMGPVKRNKKDKIQVHYDTKKPGPFHKTMTVYSNASNNVVKIEIKGNVLPKK